MGTAERVAANGEVGINVAAGEVENGISRARKCGQVRFDQSGRHRMIAEKTNRAPLDRANAAEPNKAEVLIDSTHRNDRRNILRCPQLNRDDFGLLEVARARDQY